MFSKLHRQMTVFCTLSTGIIFLSLSLVCFAFAQNSIRQNSYTSFLKELGTLLANLQSEDIISHQWLNQMQEDHHLSIYLYDNGKPLHYQQLQNHTSSTTPREADTSQILPALAMEQARSLYGLDILKDNSRLSTLHEEFTLKAADMGQFYASVGILGKSNGHLGFIILYPLAEQQQQLDWLGFVIFLANMAALLLLFTFSWLFTGRMLLPLEENRRQQSQFIASASHELRSPLTVMLSGLESLEKAGTPEERCHFTALIQEEGLRMQHLISDMLLLANVDSRGLRLHPALHQPDELLLNVFEKYEPLARQRNITLRISLPETLDMGASLPNCFCDRERILQLFSILMDNALSYTPSRGSILLFLRLHPNGSSFQQQSNSFLFGVADNGPGIPDTDKKLIFDRFYRSQSSHTDKEHFGLGLCTAKEIVTAHKGRIWVEDTQTLPFLHGGLSTISKNAGGSTFFVELPAQAS